MAKKAPNPIDRHVGSRVRMRRMMLSMSQEKLGDALGLTFQQVQKYEKGTNRVGAGRLPLIAEVLNVPVSALFSRSAVRTGGAVPSKLVTDTASARMLTAFQQIGDTAIRRSLSELAERLAAKSKMRK